MYPETLSRLLNLLERLNVRGPLYDFEALHLNLARGNRFIYFILFISAVIWWINSDILILLFAEFCCNLVYGERRHIAELADCFLT